jgi:hypothetical protein
VNDWGTLFVVGLFGSFLFGGALALDAVRFLVRHWRTFHHGSTQTTRVQETHAPAQGQRAVPPQEAPELTPWGRAAHVARRVRLVRR